MSDRTSDYQDKLDDLDEAIGGFEDAETRLRCIDLAIKSTPNYGLEQIPEVMLTARRFARFAVDGTSTWLTRVDGKTTTASSATDGLGNK